MQTGLTMNKPNAAKVVNAKYDVIYNGHTFATSLPAKFVVKNVQPAKPTVTETAKRSNYDCTWGKPNSEYTCR